MFRFPAGPLDNVYCSPLHTRICDQFGFHIAIARYWERLTLHTPYLLDFSGPMMYSSALLCPETSRCNIADWWYLWPKAQGCFSHPGYWANVHIRSKTAFNNTQQQQSKMDEQQSTMMIMRQRTSTIICTRGVYQSRVQFFWTLFWTFSEKNPNSEFLHSSVDFQPNPGSDFP